MPPESRFLTAALVLGTACDGREVAPPDYHDVLKATMGDYERVGEPGAPPEKMYANSRFSGPSAGPGEEKERLAIVHGHETVGGFLADELMAEVYVPGTFTTGSDRVVARCDGSATWADAEWTVSLTGPESCTRWNGTWTQVKPLFPEVKKRAPTLPAERILGEDPVLVLPPAATPFSTAIARIGVLRAGDQPCPVVLHAPDAALVASATPGQDALRLGSSFTDEPFSIVAADSGAILPDQPASTARYQALYVRTSHAEPEVAKHGHTFTPGHSAGRVWLVDMQAGSVVCVGDVRAENGDTMEGSTEREAGMWLILQLGMAEERAIALGLYAAVPG